MDEGFELVPPGTAAERSLTVETSSETLSLEARGSRTVRHSIDARPRAVAELELLQRAVLALRAAGSSTAARDRVPLAVVREPSKLNTELRGRLILATLEAGYGFTRTATEADVSICVESSRGLRLGAGARDGPCTPTVSGLETLRTLLDRIVRPPPQGPRAEATVVPPDAAAVDRWRLAVRGAGGGAGRALAVDPLLLVGAAASLGELGGRVDAIVAFASRGEVGAVEIFAVAGPTWSRRALSWLGLGVGLRLGVHLHRYDVEGSRSGTHADFTADLPLSLTFELEPLAIELEVAPGISSRSRRHERDLEVLWSRGAARVLVTLGASFSVGL